jgi:hypothetical protein
MAIVTIDAGSRQTAGALMVEAWKHGVEVEMLHDNQMELTCAYDEKLNKVIGKYQGVKVLHTELLKEIFE